MSFTLKPAIDKEFFNRKELMDEMLKTLTDPNIQMGFSLIGPRRVGKTSIYMELTRKLKLYKKIIPIYFSMWELVENSISEFIHVLSYKIIEAYKEVLGVRYKIRNALLLPISTIISILKTTDLKIKMFDEIEISLSRKDISERSTTDLIKKTFSLPEELADKTKTRCILIIDEFPSIMELKDGKAVGVGIIKAIRTINESYKNTILNISGSIRKTMEIAILSPSSPFYRQFIIKKVTPFKENDVHILLQTNLKTYINPEISNYIYNETKGIPFYVQFIGRKLLQRKDTSLNTRLVNNCINEFLQEEGNLIFSEELLRIGQKERLVLSVMSKNEEISISQIAKDARENINAVSRYISYLVNKGIVSKKRKGLYAIDDPMFRKWIEMKKYKE